MSKMSKNLQCTLVSVAVSASVLGGAVHALACQYAVRTSDNAVLNTFPIPVFSSAKDFVMRQSSDFVIPEGAFANHGAEAFDDPKFEYTKLWMSSYLLAQGTYFSTSGKDTNGQQLVFDRAFHTAKDYYTMAKGEPDVPSIFGPRTHGRFLSLLGGPDPIKLAQYVWSEHPPFAAAFCYPLALFPEKTETVTTYCGLYDVNLASDPPISVYEPNTDNVYGTPAERASDLVHEAMHAHYRDVEELDHVDCSTGKRNSVGDCDYFYSHPKSDYAGDDLYIADAGSHKLPAYEVEYESLCDMLDESNDWVPLAVLSDAAGAAGRLANNKFVDSAGNKTPPPYMCGVPAPMMAPPAGAPACKGATCSATVLCNEGTCDVGCCVVVK